MHDWDDRGSTVVNLPLRLQPARLPDPTQIPPREWLYGTRLIRRFVTVLVAPGGTGKSGYALAVAMALASGRPFLGETVHHRVNSWVLNLEDPLEELDRRVAAIMVRHKIPRSDLDGHLFLHSGRDRRLVMATQSDDGYAILYPDKEAVIELALTAGVGHIVVDPFVKSHSLEENSNPHMDAAATAWAEVAQATGAAIDLVHHTRKGAVTDIDAARGGKALTDAARVGQIMAAMSVEESSDLGIKETERWKYVRLDDAKVNMSPRADKARWFRLEEVALHNGNILYPNGDKVAALAVWEPPSVWDTLTGTDLNRALDTIAEGPEPGTLFAAFRRGQGVSRWAGNVLVEMFERTEEQASKMINIWLQSGLLVQDKYYDKGQRKDRSGVRVVDDKRPSQ